MNYADNRKRKAALLSPKCPTAEPYPLGRTETAELHRYPVAATKGFRRQKRKGFPFEAGGDTQPSQFPYRRKTLIFAPFLSATISLLPSQQDGFPMGALSTGLPAILRHSNRVNDYRRPRQFLFALANLR